MVLAKDKQVNPFGAYRVRARGTNETERLLHGLKDLAAGNGGRLGKADLDSVTDPTAKAVLDAALRHRSVMEAIPEAAVSTEPWAQKEDGTWELTGSVGFSKVHPNRSPIMYQDFALPRLNQMARERAPSISLEEMTPEWFAAYFVLACARTGYGESKDRPPLVSHVWPEVSRFVATQSGATLGEGDEDDRVDDAHYRARVALLINTQLAMLDPEFVANGADVIGARAVLASAEASDDLLSDRPSESLSLLDVLTSEGLSSMQVCAAEEQRAAVGRFGVLEATAAHLTSIGLLSKSTFQDLEIAIRTHALPSLRALVDVLTGHGARHLRGKYKGISTSPVTAAGLERFAKQSDPGYADSLRTFEEHQADLVDFFDEAATEAETSSRPLLVLGDGRDTAGAMVEAMAHHPELLAAYVEFTMSGLNVLSPLGALGFFVDTLADTALKKGGESDILGDWFVDQLEHLLPAEIGRGLSEVTVAQVGYGESVGPGICRALDRRQVDYVALDKDRGREGAEYWDTGEPLPVADVYVLATGGEKVFDEATLRSLPDGATVVCYGSRGEIDEDFLRRALLGRAAGVRAFAVKNERVPEHDTILLRFDDRTVRVLKRGQPFFDGRLDKDPMLVDMYMSGLLAAMCLAAERLKTGGEDAEIRSVPVALQREILDLLAAAYTAPKYQPIFERVRGHLS